MNNVTKGVLIGVAGALICREFYAHGYNKGQDVIIDKINLMVKVKDAVEKEGKGES